MFFTFDNVQHDDPEETSTMPAFSESSMAANIGKLRKIFCNQAQQSLRDIPASATLHCNDTFGNNNWIRFDWSV